MKEITLFGLIFLSLNVFSQDITIEKILFEQNVDPVNKYILNYKVSMTIEEGDTSIYFTCMFKDFNSKDLKIGTIAFYDTVRIKNMINCLESVLKATSEEKITASFRGGSIFNKIGDLNYFYLKEKMNDEDYDEFNDEYVTTKLTQKQLEKFIADTKSIYHYFKI
jgi:hypothetical protein